MLEFKYDTQLLIEGENLDEDERDEYLNFLADKYKRSIQRIVCDSMIAQLTMEAGYPAYHLPFIDFRDSVLK